MSENISAESLARAGFVSRAKLYRDFYNVTGHSMKEYVAEHAPGSLKDINEFYVRQQPDRFVYGIFAEGLMADREEGKLKRKKLPRGLYLILEGEAAGGYDDFKEIIVSFAAENALHIDEEEIFGIYHTEYGFRNPGLRLFAAVY